MTNSAKSMNFIRMLENIFIFQATVLKFGDLLGDGSCQKFTVLAQYLQKLSRIGQKKTQGHGFEYHYIKSDYSLMLSGSKKFL